MATHDPLDDVLELARLLRPAWDDISDGIPAWHPRCEGDDAGDGAGDGAADGDDGAGDGAGDADGTAGDAGDGKDVDWKRESRKHEARAKQERKAREALESKIAEIENSNKSEHEKALAKAREEAAAEERGKGEQARRDDRLEVAVTRLSAKDFADTEDALLNVRKAISDGEIDPDDIFTTEGKVQTDALKTALEDLLDRKPHLRAAGNGRPAGDADAGKGSPGKGVEDMSVDEHFKAVRRS